MLKDIIEKNESVTINQNQIDILKRYFPSCFNNEGSFDVKKLEHVLNERNVDITKEGYELNFLGKSYAKLLTALESETIVKPNLEHNSKKENRDSENIYITGDNLDAIKHLLKSYAGKIKCIYIDPPYNTGSDGFVYMDNFKFTPEQLSEKIGISEEEAQRILNMTSRGSGSHSAWLTFMYPRLYIARDLLSDDGVIFISIDNNEEANLKLLCDDIFGEENYLGSIVRSTGQTTGQDSGGLGSSFDYILTYAKDPEVDLSGLPLTKHDLKRFENEDEKGKYAYDQMRKTGSNDRREDRPNMYYAVKDPDGNDVYPIGPNGYESCWRFERKTYEQLVKENIILWKKTKREDNEIWWPYVKYYLEGRTKRPSPLWTDLDGNKKATRDVRALFDGKKVFDYAKPIDLIIRILKIVPNANENDIILDFFSGSATTAHAVMQLNAEIGGNRKYIMVQIPEKCNEDGDAYKAGYRTINEIGIQRIKRAAEKIKSETKKEIDYGFKIYELVSPQEKTLDKMLDFDPNKLVEDTSILTEFGNEAVLTTWKVQDGYGFNTQLEEVNLSGYIVYKCENTLYFINPNITTQAIKTLIEKYQNDRSFFPNRIVIFGYSFNFTQLSQLKDNLKQLTDYRKIDIITRY
ncbi:DNA (cytosine-5-)-methyltransferase [Clostridiales bacterium oral taxon 876 str. F0540]|nr:DNA (cytosine-5-)-methyltransferase [Clostridiales bacterium oral taxon 876 str. F0540]